MHLKFVCFIEELHDTLLDTGWISSRKKKKERKVGFYELTEVYGLPVPEKGHSSVTVEVPDRIPVIPLHSHSVEILSVFVWS